MDNIKGFVPEGVEDVNSLEFGMKDKVIKDINSVFKNFGYRQILTPTFEYYDLFNEIEGTIEKEEMFKFIDRHGRILVLRPDATIPIARMGLSLYKNKKEALKFSYSTNVFRMQSNENGGKAEFTQSGIEFLGEEGAAADAEVIVIAIESILKCGFKDFKIDIGEASYFKALIEETNLSKAEINEIKKYIEAKNFTGLEFYMDSIIIDNEIKNVILSLPNLYGNAEKVIEKAKSLSINDKMKEAVENLYEIYKVIKEYGYEKYILADLGLVRHLNYYTGLVFKGYVNGVGKEVLGGGRYDNLTKSYGEYMPSTGFGINVDSVIEAMRINSLCSEKVENIDYRIVYAAGRRKEAILTSKMLREKGYSVDTRKESESYSLGGYEKLVLIDEKICVESSNGKNEYNMVEDFFKSI